MNAVSIGRVIFAISLLILLSGCTTKIEISHSETLRINALSDNFKMIKTVEIPDSTKGQSGFILVKLKSTVDIEKIILRREMSFLYYELRPCGDVKGSVELYSAPAFIETQAGSIEAAGYYYYYAPVPDNYPARIDGYQAMLGKSKQMLPDKICIGLGAGNMLGQTLTTNLVPIELM